MIQCMRDQQTSWGIHRYSEILVDFFAIKLQNIRMWIARNYESTLSALFEQFSMVMQIVKHFFSRGKIAPLWYWRTAHGAEVDLVVERGGKFIAIESKFAENPDLSAVKGIESLKRFYGESFFEKGYVACRTRYSFPLTKKIAAVPGSLVHQYLT